MLHPPLHYLPVVRKRRTSGRPQFVNPLGILLGGSLVVSVALLAVLLSLAFRQPSGNGGKASLCASLAPQGQRARSCVGLARDVTFLWFLFPTLAVPGSHADAPVRQLPCGGLHARGARAQRAVTGFRRLGSDRLSLFLRQTNCSMKFYLAWTTPASTFVLRYRRTSAHTSLGGSPAAQVESSRAPQGLAPRALACRVLPSSVEVTKLSAPLTPQPPPRSREHPQVPPDRLPHHLLPNPQSGPLPGIF